MSIFIAGLDLGQVQDYSALVITEAHGTLRHLQYEQIDPLISMHVPVSQRAEMLPITRLDIRHIERFPLNTKYAAIAALTEARLRGTPKPIYFAIDKTGVGVAGIEFFHRLQPHGITITAGGQAVMRHPQDIAVPKRDLIAALQIRFQNHDVKMAKNLQHADLLVKEALSFRAKISASGHDTYEAWRENEHDDLVLAASMCAWMAEHVYRIREQSILAGLEASRRQAQGPYSISPI